MTKPNLNKRGSIFNCQCCSQLKDSNPSLWWQSVQLILLRHLVNPPKKKMIIMRVNKDVQISRHLEKLGLIHPQNESCWLNSDSASATPFWWKQYQDQDQDDHNDEIYISYIAYMPLRNDDICSQVRPSSTNCLYVASLLPFVCWQSSFINWLILPPDP